jgi:hypothetical protein
MMLGTRPGAWPSLVGSLIVFAAVVGLARKSLTRAHVLRVSAAVVAALVVSYLALLAIYPRVFGDLDQALYASAFGSAHYEGLGDHLPSDRSYLFKHALIDLPLGLLTLMLTGTFVAAYMWLVQRRRSVHLDCIALVGSQAFALMTAAVVLDSDLYHGLRQMLFAIPALAVLATVGLAALLTLPRKREAPPALAGRLRIAVAVGACVAMVLPTAAQAAMFPYQYGYINVAAEQLGAEANEDYFGMSFREHAYADPQDVKIICPFLRMGYIVWRDNEPDCRTRFAHTFSAYWRGRPTPDRPKEPGEFYTLLRGSRPTPPNCEVHREVERWRNLEKTVMSRMFVCHRATREETLEGVTILNRAQQRYGIELYWPSWLGERPKSGPGSFASLRTDS